MGFADSFTLFQVPLSPSFPPPPGAQRLKHASHYGIIGKICRGARPGPARGKGENGMVCNVPSLGLYGVQGYTVDVECSLTGGLPAFDIVGLPDAAVKESRERVR